MTTKRYFRMSAKDYGRICKAAGCSSKTPPDEVLLKMLALITPEITIQESKVETVGKTVGVSLG